MLSKADIKYINSLQNKKYRKIEHAFLVEGYKNVEELLKSDYKVKRVFCSQLYLAQLAPKANVLRINIEVISEKELSQLGTLETNNSAIAIAQTKELNDLPHVSVKEIIIALDGVNDPGNLGTIVRIADWYGIKNIVCSADTVDLYNPKVINATKGSFTRVNVYYAQLETFLQSVGTTPIFAACMNGASLYETEKQLPCVLLMGNEANGIRASLLSLVTNEISIPRIGNAESLNVGVATGIVVDRLLN